MCRTEISPGDEINIRSVVQSGSIQGPVELVLGGRSRAGLRCPTLTLTGWALVQADTRNWLVAHLCRLLVGLLMVVGLQSGVKIYF